MKYLPRLAALDTMESSFLGFCHHMEKTNDQSDLRVGRADRGSRLHNSGHGCPQQRCRGAAHHDQEPYHRGLCAGSERRRVCLGSLYCTSLHAKHHQLIRTKSRAADLASPIMRTRPLKSLPPRLQTEDKSAIAYARVSNALQAKSGLGLEAPQAALVRLAEAEGHWLVETYQKVETGKGSDAPDRRR
jgi:hypothetical protein